MAEVMMMQRQSFQIATDTGSQVIYGASFSGAVMQLGWVPTTGDTGADLEVRLATVAGDDTGGSIAVYSEADCLGPTAFFRAPTQSAYQADGTEVTNGARYPVVANADRLIVKARPGGASLVGRLLVWSMGE
jgi:hypothetical protein